MEFPVSRHPDVKWNTGMLNEAEELKDADYPEIRLFHVKHQLAHEGELDDVRVNGWFAIRRTCMTFRLWALSSDVSYIKN